MKVRRWLMGKTKSWPIRLLILVGMILLVVFSRGQQHISVEAADSAPSSPPFDANEVFANVCQMPEMRAPGQAAANVTAQQSREMLGGDLRPIRTVSDPFPAFNGVVLDIENNLAVFSDPNRKSLLVYDRASGTKSPQETVPLQQIMGPKTLGGFYAGVLVDGTRREIYGVNNDIEDNMSVFSYDDAGNVKPKRVLGVPHGSWGLALSKVRDEIAITVQDVNANAVAVYRQDARNLERPLRIIQGRKTELADPHGIYFDDANQELVVANWGSWNVPLGRYYTLPPEAFPPPDLPGGVFYEPSITVHPATAQGNVAPLRKIQGAATQLNWPTGLDVDPISNEIAVANNGDNSVLVFPRTGSGNLKPTRIIRGVRTGINRPMGVAVDPKNNELWVANFGDHSAVIFDLKANGNVSPKRILRNAPAGTPNGGFGNPMSMAYDPKREELLVAN